MQPNACLTNRESIAQQTIEAVAFGLNIKCVGVSLNFISKYTVTTRQPTSLLVLTVEFAKETRRKPIRLHEFPFLLFILETSDWKVNC